MTADVIVIGAGIAGLTAAQELTQHGYRVIVLEREAYPGGRVYTDVIDGAPIDRGAYLLHGARDNPIVPLADDAGATYTSFTEPTQLHHDDCVIDPITYDRMQQIFYAALTDCVRHLCGVHAGISLRDAYMRHACSSDYNASYHAVVRWNVHRLAYYFGAEWDRVSAQSWNDDAAYPYNIHIMTSGYQPYVTYLQSGLDIRYRTCVRHVTYTKHGVTVMTDQGVYTASYAIVTVSLGVLRSGDITWEPELPRRKLNAMQAIGVGHLEKVILTFDEPFWLDTAVRFATAHYDIISHFISMQSFVGRPILVGFIPGTAAYAFTQWSYYMQYIQIMRSLYDVFRIASVPEPRSVLHTQWCVHPSTYGAFSYAAVGSDKHDMNTLAEPIPPLFFAGEATHAEQYSTVQGAYLSGRRVAQEVIDAASSCE